MLKGLLRIFGLAEGRPWTEADKAGFEKRRSPRLAYYLPCEVYDHVHFQAKGKSLIRNISFHGVCIDTDFPVQPGDEFSLSFSVAGTRFELVKAKAVWTSRIASGFRSGLQFDERLVKEIKKAVMTLMSSED